LRVANEVHILGTDSYELGDTTRHLYYMESLFLSGQKSERLYRLDTSGMGSYQMSV
jgi:hypothetical protein